MAKSVRHLAKLSLNVRSFRTLEEATERVVTVLGDLGMKSGELRMLYTTPEKAVSRQFITLLAEMSENTAIHMAIDEAHCISEWGHDFRPQYMVSFPSSSLWNGWNSNHPMCIEFGEIKSKDTYVVSVVHYCYGNTCYRHGHSKDIVDPPCCPTERETHS